MGLSAYISYDRVYDIQRVDDSICGAWSYRNFRYTRGSGPEANPKSLKTLHFYIS